MIQPYSWYSECLTWHYKRGFESDGPLTHDVSGGLLGAGLVGGAGLLTGAINPGVLGLGGNPCGRRKRQVLKGLYSYFMRSSILIPFNSRFTTVPLPPSYLINIVEDIVVFTGLKVLVSDNSNVFLQDKCAIRFHRETTLKYNLKLKLQTLIKIFLIRQCFSVNRCK